ncbi:PTS sugar transporter subunit IIB [Peptostreptococcus russellii]|uniref:PTS system, cellobiose-specific IIB component n=1 Tax=Peptostreptococcus russellii TaxID=215200 RepID=A0A1H8HEZ7_9FIRM|nr:PTS sugar transporter subunit IIB [Peptostreptococcus russellii]SEN54743.1 PTS system, cellobiose-specific IIB component [Peptostreptococcus russellii]
MKNILLVCNAGMSTSMLVKKMQDAAKSENIDVNIEAKSLTEAKKSIDSADMILVGPQIRYELNNLKKVAQDIPVEAINMQDYGMMNGKKVLKEALKAMGV